LFIFIFFYLIRWDERLALRSYSTCLMLFIAFLLWCPFCLKLFLLINRISYSFRLKVEALGLFFSIKEPIWLFYPVTRSKFCSNCTILSANFSGYLFPRWVYPVSCRFVSMLPLNFLVSLLVTYFSPQCCRDYCRHLRNHFRIEDNLFIVYLFSSLNPRCPYLILAVWCFAVRQRFI
jgi:hypothetical protein